MYILATKKYQAQEEVLIFMDSHANEMLTRYRDLERQANSTAEHWEAGRAT